MTNVQRFCQANESLDMEDWIEAYMQEFDCEYEWAELKYWQNH